EFSIPLFKSFSFFRKAYHFILLGWLKKGKGNLGSGGGWHRDSPISHQFKTILYLTDVDETNGPFQFIKGSQNWKNNLKVCKYLNLPLSNRRFKNEDIDSLISQNVIPPPTTFTSKKGGLIIADTRGLHRGKPLENGERKAITRYHFTSDIGDKFYK
ncbi:phytanoyl-CoA dioxygenase family protein, partial [Nonlabens mediterrranea]|nr:phytanoyl-CoA dioxygenase family protein [Nonlabens mediterrranea]